MSHALINLFRNVVASKPGVSAQSTKSNVSALKVISASELRMVVGGTTDAGSPYRGW